MRACDLEKIIHIIVDNAYYVMDIFIALTCSTHPIQSGFWMGAFDFGTEQ